MRATDGDGLVRENTASTHYFSGLLFVCNFPIQ